MDAFGSSWSASWTADDAPFSARLSTVPETAALCQAPAQPQPSRRQPRNSQRVQIELGAGLRQRGASGVTVQILDLSTHGFRAATHLSLPDGTDVWLRLPGLEACHAKVVWNEGHYVGCAFERPLHPAVLDMVVRNAGTR